MVTEKKEAAVIIREKIITLPETFKLSQLLFCGFEIAFITSVELRKTTFKFISMLLQALFSRNSEILTSSITMSHLGSAG